ncbi:hypothetical protein V8E53_015586, partial [Lactarius tabidus]
MVWNLTITAVSFEDLSVKYITFDFQDYLTDFITRSTTMVPWQQSYMPMQLTHY